MLEKSGHDIRREWNVELTIFTAITHTHTDIEWLRLDEKKVKETQKRQQSARHSRIHYKTILKWRSSATFQKVALFCTHLGRWLVHIRQLEQMLFLFAANDFHRMFDAKTPEILTSSEAFFLRFIFETLQTACTFSCFSFLWR